jgi:hypothetical protein
MAIEALLTISVGASLGPSVALLFGPRYAVRMHGPLELKIPITSSAPNIVIVPVDWLPKPTPTHPGPSSPVNVAWNVMLPGSKK